MVKKMNKREFIEKLSYELSYTIDECTIINDILESNFFISKKSKDKIINDLIQKLSITEREAERIYDISISIVKEEIKHKMKHPFKNQD